MHRLNYIVDDNGIINIIDTAFPEVLQKRHAILCRKDYIRNGNNLRDKHSTGVFTTPNINDPFTQLELCCFSKHPLLDNNAHKWFYKKRITREQERLRLKSCLKAGTHTINDLLEFDDDLYQ